MAEDEGVLFDDAFAEEFGGPPPSALRGLPETETKIPTVPGGPATTQKEFEIPGTIEEMLSLVGTMGRNQKLSFRQNPMGLGPTPAQPRPAPPPAPLLPVTVTSPDPFTSDFQAFVLPPPAPRPGEPGYVPPRRDEPGFTGVAGAFLRGMGRGATNELVMPAEAALAGVGPRERARLIRLRNQGNIEEIPAYAQIVWANREQEGVLSESRQEATPGTWANRAGQAGTNIGQVGMGSAIMSLLPLPGGITRAAKMGRAALKTAPGAAAFSLQQYNQRMDDWAGSKFGQEHPEAAQLEAALEAVSEFGTEWLSDVVAFGAFNGIMSKAAIGKLKKFKPADLGGMTFRDWFKKNFYADIAKTLVAEGLTEELNYVLQSETAPWLAGAATGTKMPHEGWDPKQAKEIGIISTLTGAGMTALSAGSRSSERDAVMKLLESPGAPPAARKQAVLVAFEEIKKTNPEAAQVLKEAWNTAIAEGKPINLGAGTTGAVGSPSFTDMVSTPEGLAGMIEKAKARKEGPVPEQAPGDIAEVQGRTRQALLDFAQEQYGEANIEVPKFVEPADDRITKESGGWRQKIKDDLEAAGVKTIFVETNQDTAVSLVGGKDIIYLPISLSEQEAAAQVAAHEKRHAYSLNQGLKPEYQASRESGAKDLSLEDFVTQEARLRSDRQLAGFPQPTESQLWSEGDAQQAAEFERMVGGNLTGQDIEARIAKLARENADKPGGMEAFVRGLRAFGAKIGVTTPPPELSGPGSEAALIRYGRSLVELEKAARAQGGPGQAAGANSPPTPAPGMAQGANAPGTAPSAPISGQAGPPKGLTPAEDDLYRRAWDVGIRDFQVWQNDHKGLQDEIVKRTPKRMLGKPKAAYTLVGNSAANWRDLSGKFTGVYDRRMRAEISDDKMTFKPRALSSPSSVKYMGPATGGVFQQNADPTNPAIWKRRGELQGKLGDIIDHPELFKAYPALRKLPVQLYIDPKFLAHDQERTGDPWEQYVEGTTHGITDRGRESEIEVTGITIKTNGWEDALNILAHEIQHWIQMREDFSPGTGVDQMRDTVYAGARFPGYWAQPKAGYEGRLEQNTHGVRWGGGQPDMIEQGRGEVMDREGQVAYRNYRRTFGEMEARNTEHRRKFTPEQRRMLPVYRGEDVLPEQDIPLKTGAQRRMDLDSGWEGKLYGGFSLRDGRRVTHFRSGASADDTFAGYAMASYPGEPGRRVPIGVEINSLGEETIAKVAEHANNGGQVFIDSGAFPVFRKMTATNKDGTPKDPKMHMGFQAIGTPEFQERYRQAVNFPKVLAKYKRIADATRVKGNLYIVGTDLIGDQDATIEEVARYREELRGLIDSGVNVLMPVQRGRLAPSEAYQKIIDTLGTDKIVASIPMNEAFYDLDELREFFTTHQPERVHLLGLGPSRKPKMVGGRPHPGYEKVLQLIEELAPNAQLTSDSNRMRSMLGQGKPFTDERQRLMREELGPAVDDALLAGDRRPRKQIEQEKRGEFVRKATADVAVESTELLGQRVAYSLAWLNRRYRDVENMIPTDSEGPRLIVDSRLNEYPKGSPEETRLLDQIERFFRGTGKTFGAMDRSKILIPFKELDNPRFPDNQLRSRIWHMIRDGKGNLHPAKAEWILQVPRTLENAPVRLVNDSNGYRVYVNRYKGQPYLHAVVVRPDGMVDDGLNLDFKTVNTYMQEAVNGGLVTQYRVKPDSKERVRNLRVDYVREDLAEPDWLEQIKMGSESGLPGTPRATLKSASSPQGAPQDVGEENIAPVKQKSNTNQQAGYALVSPRDLELARPKMKDPEAGPLWYSRLRRAVEALKQEKLSVQQLRAAVKENVDSDERFWTGFDEHLDQLEKSGQKSITKTDALKFLEEHDITIEEIPMLTERVPGMLRGGGELEEPRKVWKIDNDPESNEYESEDEAREAIYELVDDYESNADREVPYTQDWTVESEDVTPERDEDADEDEEDPEPVTRYYVANDSGDKVDPSDWSSWVRGAHRNADDDGYFETEEDAQKFLSRMEQAYESEGESIRDSAYDYYSVYEEESTEDQGEDTPPKNQAITSNRPHYQGHVSPGGQDYGELLILVPRNKGSKVAPPPGWKIVENPEYATRGDAVYRYLVYAPGKYDADLAARGEATNGVYDDMDEAIRDSWAKQRQMSGEEDDTYDNSHYGSMAPNLVVHIRFNTRVIDGKKTLYIEEIQSDWGQHARKSGLKGAGEPAPTPLTELPPGISVIEVPNPTEKSERDTTRIAKWNQTLTNFYVRCVNLFPEEANKENWAGYSHRDTDFKEWIRGKMYGEGLIADVQDMGEWGGSWEQRKIPRNFDTQKFKNFKDTLERFIKENLEPKSPKRLFGAASEGSEASKIMEPLEDPFLFLQTSEPWYQAATTGLVAGLPELDFEAFADKESATNDALRMINDARRHQWSERQQDKVPAGPFISGVVRADVRKDPDGTYSVAYGEKEGEDEVGKNIVLSGATKEEALAKKEELDAQNAIGAATEPWTRLAVRRMIRWAAEHGFDRVAWTGAGIQVQRWQQALRQKVDKIAWQPHVVTGANDAEKYAGAKKVTFYKDDSMLSSLTMYVDKDGTVFGATVSDNNGRSINGRNITAVVGDKMGKQITADDGGEIEGNDLTVGGEGFRGYYERIVPAAFEAVGKKFGVKVGTTRLRLADGVAPGKKAFVVEPRPDGSPTSNDLNWAIVDSRTGLVEYWADNEAAAMGRADKLNAGLSPAGDGEDLGKILYVDMNEKLSKAAMGGFPGYSLADRPIAPLRKPTPATRRQVASWRERGLDAVRAAEWLIKYAPAGGRPAEDIIDKVPEGRDYIQKVRKAWSDSLQRRARWNQPLTKAMHRLSSSDRAYIRDSFMQDYEAGGVGRRWPSAAVRDFARAWYETNTAISADAGRAIESFRGRDASTYVPHRLTPQGREIMQRQSGPEWDALVDQARVNGIDVSMLSALREAPLRQSHYGNIDYARIANLPWTVTVDGKQVKILETDPGVLFAHIRGAARRISTVEYFGSDSATQNYLDGVAAGLVGGGALDADQTKEAVGRIWKRLQGQDAMAGREMFGSAHDAWQLFDSVVASLALSGAVVGNLIGGHLPETVRMGIIPTARAFKEAFTTSLQDPSLEELQALVDLQGDILQDLQATETLSGRAAQNVGKLLKVTGFVETNRRINLAVAMAMQRQNLRLMLEAVRAEGAGKRFSLWERHWGKDARAARAYLAEELGFSEEDVQRMAIQGPSDQDMSRAINKELELVNAMNESPESRPKYVANPIWRAFFAYSTFVRKMYDTTKYAAREAKAGNFRPATTLIVAGLPTAALMQAIKDFLKDREREEEGYIEKFFNSMAEVGALGLATSWKYGIMRMTEPGGRDSLFKDIFDTPHYSFLADAIGAIGDTGVQRSLRPLWKALAKHASLFDIIEKQVVKNELLGRSLSEREWADRLVDRVYTRGRRLKDGTEIKALDPIPRSKKTKSSKMLVDRLRETMTDEQILKAIRAAEDRRKGLRGEAIPDDLTIQVEVADKNGDTTVELPARRVYDSAGRDMDALANVEEELMSQ